MVANVHQMMTLRLVQTVTRLIKQNGGKPARTSQLRNCGYDRETLRAAARAGLLVETPLSNGKLVTNGWTVSAEALTGAVVSDGK